ncbi:HAD family hydrolase [Amaricoccus solimangrovi]|uniref:phosphoglycolate phosphatase n=1 Tax=Amaricoccus solimangrovi TaxID=2589815 RepID=A0A501WN12_9RHOB|nr:HAD family hydrolase [Amaricoccus solimangrovi]TPE50242.1 HAD family hydrolase [Amaricoccus solimangrovi]
MRDQVRGLVFDKDGTLFDFNATWSAWCHGFILGLAEGDPARAEALAERLGYELEKRRFLKTSPVIAGTMEFVVQAALGVRPEFGEARLRRHIVASTSAAPQVEAAPLIALLDRLRAGGLVLGVATNDSEAPARVHLERAGVIDRFAFIAGYDSGHGAKPTPGMLLAFSAATGIPPEACAMIGDSVHDLASGRAAGMTTIGVLTGPASAEDLAPHADAVLPDIGALPAWLGLAE